MQIVFLTFMFILGACFGSFLCCQARRLRLKETSGDSHRKSKSKTVPRQTAQLQSNTRSVCLSCGYQLRWYDNIPILSWLFLRGKCRKCHHKIGIAELLSELGTALAFLGISAHINYGSTDVLPWATFVATLAFAIMMIFLAIYDGISGELPTIFLTFAITQIGRAH